MVKVVLDAKEWISILSSFGSLIEDVEINATENELDYLVGHSTHAVRYNKIYGDAIKNTGRIAFTDLKNTMAFLKKSKGDVTISQLSNKIVIQNQKKSISIPSYECKSSQLSQTLSRLLVESEENNWEKFGRKVVLNCHADADFTELVSSLSVAKGLNKESDYLIKFNAEENELALQVKKTGGIAFTCYVNTTNSEGGNGTVSSSFGQWLLDALSCLSEGEAQFHLGSGTPLIIIQEGEDWERTVLIIDQE